MIYAISVIEKIIVSLLLILVLGIAFAPITKTHDLQEKQQIKNNFTSTTVVDAGTKESQEKKGKHV